MNNVEKKSFYSCLGLYIVSAVLFIILIGYWYHSVQKNTLENETYYQLQHIADIKKTEIMMANIQGIKLKNTFVPDGIELALIDVKGMIKEGKLVEPFMSRESGYFKARGYNIFVSEVPKTDLNIAFVVVQSDTLHNELEVLRETVLKFMLFSAMLIAMIVWGLSKQFMHHKKR